MANVGRLPRMSVETMDGWSGVYEEEESGQLLHMSCIIHDVLD
jgi:hypothetical protein